MYRRILVADDGNEPGAAALNEAINLAKTDGGELRVVFVTQRPIPDGDAVSGKEADWSASREAGRQVIDRATLRATKAGTRASAKLIDAADEPIAKAVILEAQAWRADLVVMGTRGWRVTDHFILGSVAEAILKTATTPVLLIRAAVR